MSSIHSAKYAFMTVDDKNFWKLVCSMCGKRFDAKYLKDVHMENQNVPRNKCIHCLETISLLSNIIVSKKTIMV
jgi:hypothetical protein